MRHRLCQIRKSTGIMSLAIGILLVSCATAAAQAISSAPGVNSSRAVRRIRPNHQVSGPYNFYLNRNHVTPVTGSSPISSMMQDSEFDTFSQSNPMPPTAGLSTSQIAQSPVSAQVGAEYTPPAVPPVESFPEIFSPLSSDSADEGSIKAQTKDTQNSSKTEQVVWKSTRVNSSSTLDVVQTNFHSTDPQQSAENFQLRAVSPTSAERLRSTLPASGTLPNLESLLQEIRTSQGD